NAGAPTLVQDEATSVVWGMPGAAIKLGATDEQVPLERIAERLMALARGSHPDAARRRTSNGRALPAATGPHDQRAGATG
uniref:chemotaxis protein CheB n=1 Tax=Stenotrophomonas sp. SrG TaxID=3414430 RepID=UPI003CF5A0F0